MALLPPKLCPECGDEFVHTHTRCGSCDVDLVSPEEADRIHQSREKQLSGSEDLIPIRAEHAAWIDALALRLEAERIPCSIAVLEEGNARGPRGSDASLVLLVRPEDAVRARALDQELLRSQLPDISDDVDLSVSETEACPACGTPIAESDLECQDCGLGFGSGE